MIIGTEVGTHYFLISAVYYDSEPKDESKAAPAAKNFFMDIYAKEVSKMQSASKSSAPTKKRNFDATQFNTYGKPLGK